MADAGGGAAGAVPDALAQEILRLRAANQAAARENSRLRADAADREYEGQQLDKTIRKLERKIEALEDAGSRRASQLSRGFLKPAPADFQPPPVERKAPEQPRPKPWEKVQKGGSGCIIDAATGEEVDPKAFWPEQEAEKEENLLLRKGGVVSPEEELMLEMQNPVEVNPEFDSQKYGDLIGAGKQEDAEAMIRREGGPTQEQMQVLPLEVLRANPKLDPNWCDPKFGGCSLLQWACSMGFGEVAAELLARGADPNHRTKGGMSILASVCSRNWPQCAQQLLEARANPNEVIEPAGGRTILMWASRIEYADEEGREHLNPFVSMLLQCRVDHEARDQRGQTALMHASTEGSACAVEALLEARADVDAQDSEGNTAWQIALRYCHGRVSSLLIPRRAKREAPAAAPPSAGDQPPAAEGPAAAA